MKHFCAHIVVHLVMKGASFATLCLFLAGCTQGTIESDLRDYNARLARVLDQAAPESAAAKGIRLPEPRNLKLDVATIDIDLLEFLRLGDCELQGVIAENNSSLGRFAVDSLALNQDVRFLNLSQQCLSILDDVTLRQTLLTAIEGKRRQLPLRLWNAIFAGAEYREFWHSDVGTYPDAVESQMQYALTELQLNSNAILSDQETNFNHKSFEAALTVLRSGEAGALLRSWQLVHHQLDLATTIVKQRTKRKPLCFPDMRNPKAEYFRNLVVGQFVGVIQRDIAILNRRYYEVMLPLQALERSFEGIETHQYRQFRQSRDQEFRLAIDSVKAHVAALEPLMVQCGFLSGPSE